LGARSCPRLCGRSPEECPETTIGRGRAAAPGPGRGCGARRSARRKSGRAAGSCLVRAGRLFLQGTRRLSHPGERNTARLSNADTPAGSPEGTPPNVRLRRPPDSGQRGLGRLVRASAPQASPWPRSRAVTNEVDHRRAQPDAPGDRTAAGIDLVDEVHARSLGDGPSGTCRRRQPRSPASWRQERFPAGRLRG
jgi:hypothetical protein